MMVESLLFTLLLCLFEADMRSNNVMNVCDLDSALYRVSPDTHIRFHVNNKTGLETGMFLKPNLDTHLEPDQSN